MNVEVNIIDDDGERVWGSVFRGELEEDGLIGKRILSIDFDEEMHMNEGDTLEIEFLDNC